MLYEVITVRTDNEAAKQVYQKAGFGPCKPDIVITSYSIHYTKLYDWERIDEGIALLRKIWEPYFLVKVNLLFES